MLLGQSLVASCIHHRATPSVLRQVFALASAGVLGKLLGIVREIIFAGLFGTGAATEGFRAAMTATLAPIHVLTSEVLTAVFVPHFRKSMQENKAEAWALFSGLGLLLFLLATLLSTGLFLGAEYIVSLLYPGFSPARAELVKQMLRVMAVGVPFYVLFGLLSSLEAGHGFFRLVGLRPLIQNIGVIIAIILGYFGNNPVWIAWGFSGSYVLLDVLALVLIIKNKFLDKHWHRYFARSKPSLVRMWQASKPVLLFSGLCQGNLVLEKAVASLVGAGAVAAVDYARLIPETIQVLLVVPLGFVSLSAMAGLSDEAVGHKTDYIAALVLLLILPLSCFVLVAAPQIVMVTYARGAFDADSVVLTTTALRGMAVGMWAVCLAHAFQRVYNSRLKNREVLKIGAVGLAANVLCNLLLYRYLGVLALGLGFSIGGITMVCLYMMHIGSLTTVRHLGWVCFVGGTIYFIGACFLAHYTFQKPVVALFAHSLFAIILWGIAFMFCKTSRHLICHAVLRLKNK